MGQIHKMIGAAAIAIVVTAPGISSAQVLSDQWQYSAAIYGWLPTIRGTTTFPAGGSDLNVDASQIISHIKFVAMGTFAAQKDRWGAFTDIIYVDVGGSKSGTRDLTVGGITLPAGVTANASLDVKSTIWTLAASYRVLAEPGSSLDAFVGGRSIELKQNLGWSFSADVGGVTPPPRSGGSEAKVTNFDAIVGVKGRSAFGSDHEWYIPYYVDIGTGDSDLTWQAIGGIGYTFHWGEVFAVWRYLDYKFKNEKIEDANFSGPAIGVAFHW